MGGDNFGGVRCKMVGDLVAPKEKCKFWKRVDFFGGRRCSGWLEVDFWIIGWFFGAGADFGAVWGRIRGQLIVLVLARKFLEWRVVFDPPGYYYPFWRRKTTLYRWLVNINQFG